MDNEAEGIAGGLKMHKQSLKRAVVATTIALLLAAGFVRAQSDGQILKITRPLGAEKQYNRTAPVAQMERDSAFARLHPERAQAERRSLGRVRSQANQSTAMSRAQAASAPALQSFGTGGGDIFEIEPNDSIAQGVSLPVNIFGEISFDGDVDFFAFPALAGQQITVEAFAARLSGSQLIADIALFDASGRLLDEDVGDEDNDPLLRYTPASNEVLIVGIADEDDFGGSAFDYLLNITRGIDVDEDEPNDRRAQDLPELPVTIFGEIDGRGDVDFYSFVASAGQTLIVDVDAEVLGSRLDPEINLSDPTTGAEFFYNDQNDGDDSRFNIVLPYTGRYVIGISAFNSNSTGFYRLNASIVSGAGAPLITRVTKISKKIFEVSGIGFTSGTVVEVNGRARNTTTVSSGTLRAKVKARVGDVVTVRNPPDDRRSNPLIVQ